MIDTWRRHMLHYWRSRGKAHTSWRKWKCTLLKRLGDVFWKGNTHQLEACLRGFTGHQLTLPLCLWWMKWKDLVCQHKARYRRAQHFQKQTTDWKCDKIIIEDHLDIFKFIKITLDNLKEEKLEEKHHNKYVFLNSTQHFCLLIKVSERWEADGEDDTWEVVLSRFNQRPHTPRQITDGARIYNHADVSEEVLAAETDHRTVPTDFSEARKISKNIIWRPEPGSCFLCCERTDPANTEVYSKGNDVLVRPQEKFDLDFVFWD